MPYGWCAVCALGAYDPTKGGHLVLEEFGLIVEFPPGSVILLPSSTIRHGNTPVSPTETRYSFTQFCPGGLLRWTHHGFVPEWTLREEDRKEAYGRRAYRNRKGVLIRPGERFVEMLGLFSVYEDLAQDYDTCFGQ